MVGKVDDLTTRQLTAVLSKRVRVDPGMASKKRILTRRLQPQRDRLLRMRHNNELDESGAVSACPIVMMNASRHNVSLGYSRLFE